MEDLINRLEILSGVEVTIDGNKVWAKGDTKEYRQELKELGGRWSPKEMGWWFTEKTAKTNPVQKSDMNALQFLTMLRQCVECGAIQFELEDGEINVVFNEEMLDNSN